MGGDEEYLESSDVGSEDSSEDLDPLAQEGVDLQPRRRRTKLKFDSDCELALFELNMVFENEKKFRDAVADYAVQNMVKLKLRPNEKTRVRAKCAGGRKCRWELFASLDKDSGDFIVKKYYPAHKYLTKSKNKLCNAKFIARHLEDRIVSLPEMRIYRIQEYYKEVWGLYVGRTVCARAKMMVLNKFMGDWKAEFARLLDYADMLKSTNPGISCRVRTDSETVPGKHLFKYFYVCFDALKRGWLEGCRRIIGFDGCFLKGCCKGELLVAIGKNGNQQMFLIAWALVDQETIDSWSFFINYLIEDLEGQGLTVMSDMQKVTLPILYIYLFIYLFIHLFILSVL